MMPVAILCGGFATRLRPLTDNLPKSLIDIHGKPFIAWQLELLQRQRITDVVLCVGHLGEMIQNVVGDGSQYGVNVAYSFDGPTPLGTAGALLKALPLLGNEFFVLYGDAYLECDYRQVAAAFYASNEYALMTVYRNDNLRRCNNVLMHKNRLVLYDKVYPTPRMHYIDYGLAVLSNKMLSEPGRDLSDWYHYFSRAGWLDAYEVTTPLYNIGSFEGLEELQQYLKEKT
jgi:N-acetyl-alpha-D-muramate 1-phosphate uridylyltransferase